MKNYSYKNIVLVILIGLGLLSSCHKKDDFSKNSNAISDLLPINGDTIIAVRYYRGLLITTDGGVNWNPISNNIILKYIIIDMDGTLWGLDSWIGIHESSYSRLYKSIDKGLHWSNPIEFETNKFFPLHFISRPYNVIEVRTFENKIYKLSGSNPSSDWTLKDSIQKSEYEPLVSSDSVYKLLKNNLLKKQKDGNYKVILTLEQISTPTDILVDKNTLYISGSKDGGYKAFFSKITDERKIKEYDLSGAIAIGIRKDYKNRIWTFGDNGIFLLENDSLIKRY